MLGKNKKETGKAAKCTRLFSVVMVVAMVLGGFVGIVSTDIGSRNASAEVDYVSGTLSDISYTKGDGVDTGYVATLEDIHATIKKDSVTISGVLDIDVKNIPLDEAYAVYVFIDFVASKSAYYYPNYPYGTDVSYSLDAFNGDEPKSCVLDTTDGYDPLRFSSLWERRTNYNSEFGMVITDIGPGSTGCTLQLEWEVPCDPGTISKNFEVTIGTTLDEVTRMFLTASVIDEQDCKDGAAWQIEQYSQSLMGTLLGGVLPWVDTFNQFLTIFQAIGDAKAGIDDARHATATNCLWVVPAVSSSDVDMDNIPDVKHYWETFIDYFHNKAMAGQNVSVLCLWVDVYGMEALANCGYEFYADANEDHYIDMRDVTYTKLVIFGKKPETELADAYHDGEIDVLDVVQMRLIILGRESELTLRIWGNIITVLGIRGDYLPLIISEGTLSVASLYVADDFASETVSSENWTVVCGGWTAVNGYAEITSTDNNGRAYIRSTDPLPTVDCAKIFDLDSDNAYYVHYTDSDNYMAFGLTANGAALHVKSGGVLQEFTNADFTWSGWNSFGLGIENGWVNITDVTNGNMVFEVQPDVLPSAGYLLVGNSNGVTGPAFDEVMATG